MSIFKRIVSAALALLLIPVLLPVGTAQAAAAKKEGYENGNGLKLTKLGSYVSGISNLDGGVAEIVSMTWWTTRPGWSTVLRESWIS